MASTSFPIRIMGNNLTHLVDEVLDAFWAVVVDAYPNAKTGDLNPLLEEHLESAAKASVAEWINNNV